MELLRTFEQYVTMQCQVDTARWCDTQLLQTAATIKSGDQHSCNSHKRSCVTYDTSFLAPFASELGDADMHVLRNRFLFTCIKFAW